VLVLFGRNISPISVVLCSGRTMARGSTQPVTEMSTRGISCEGGGGGFKAAGA
jgi:hypothetical protein